MDTIRKFIPGPFRKGKVTVNPNQSVEKVQELNKDLEKVQDCSDDFINQELHKLDEVEATRPLTPSEEEREDILLNEKMSREFNTKEAKEKAAKREEYAVNLRERVAETPSPFKEYQRVGLKASLFPELSNDSEGFILDVLPPHLDEDGVVRYEYVLEVHTRDPETSKTMGISIWTVDEDELEAI